MQQRASSVPVHQAGAGDGDGGSVELVNWSATKLFRFWLACRVAKSPPGKSGVHWIGIEGHGSLGARAIDRRRCSPFTAPLLCTGQYVRFLFPDFSWAKCSSYLSNLFAFHVRLGSQTPSAKHDPSLEVTWVKNNKVKTPRMVQMRDSTYYIGGNVFLQGCS